MALALSATVVAAADSNSGGAIAAILLATAAGAAAGLWRARRVDMTQMPELIAVLHSFAGLEAVQAGWNSYLEVEAHDAQPHVPAELLRIHHAEVFIGIFIGAVTFTGSLVAFLKLSARIKSRPLMLPGKNALNLGALAAFAALTVWFTVSPRRPLMVSVTALALALGWHLAASIGGDMPVVVSMLNSYSGWAAAAAGFVLDNNLLIVTGALVGSSGAYLSYIMCKAMNRSFLSVIAGGSGIEAAPTGDEEQGRHHETRAEEAAGLLARARSVVIPPATAWPWPRHSIRSRS